MGAYTLKAIDELRGIHHGAVKLAAAELEVESFGMQVLDFPAGFADYPVHDHANDGQEEVYVVLRGSADVEVDGERLGLTAGQLLRVDAHARRRIEPGAHGVRILAIGCTARGAYERPEGFCLEAAS